MMFGAWGNPDHDDCVRIVHAALDAGINFVDTADVYSAGESEEIVAKALAGGRRDGVVLATKFHAPMGADPNMTGNSRRWIMREVESSLRRLKTDWIDLYQIHRPDPTCDIDDTLGALSDLVHQGKVRAIGCSTFPADLIVEAQWVAERRGPRALRVRAAAVLDPGPGHRGRRAARLPALRDGRHRLEPPQRRLAHRPLPQGRPHARGGRASRMPDRFSPSRPEVAAKLEAIEALVDVADEAGVPLTHLALAFVLTHPAVTSAIIGPRTMEQMTGTLGRIDVALLRRDPGPHRRHRRSRHHRRPRRRRVDAASVADAWRRRRPLATRAGAR